MFWASAQRAGVRGVLTEDLQNGFTLQGVNPFKRANERLIDARGGEKVNGQLRREQIAGDRSSGSRGAPSSVSLDAPSRTLAWNSSNGNGGGPNVRLRKPARDKPRNDLTGTTPCRRRIRPGLAFGVELVKSGKALPLPQGHRSQPPPGIRAKSLHAIMVLVASTGRSLTRMFPINSRHPAAKGLR
jgi:hypothetical protein